MRPLALLIALAVCTTIRAEEPLKLALKLTPGQQVSHRVSTSGTMIQSAAGAPAATVERTVTADFNWKVLRIDPDGKATLSLTFADYIFKEKNPAGEVSYDSTVAGGEPPSSLRDIAAVLGTEFSVIIGPDGRALQADGIEPKLPALFEKLGIPPGPHRSKMEEGLQRLLGFQRLMEMVDGFSAAYPPQPVTTGASWPSEQSMNLGVPLKLKGTWTLAKRAGAIATLTEQAEAFSDPDAPAQMSNGIAITYKMKGSASRSVDIDETTGLPAHDRTVYKLAGEGSAGPSPQRPQGASWTVQMDMTVDILPIPK